MGKLHLEAERVLAQNASKALYLPPRYASKTNGTLLMAVIKVYTSRYCGYCSAAKHLLASHGYEYEEIDLQSDRDLMIEVMQKSGQRTVPQIFIGEHSVGGYRELLAAATSGELAQLVADI